MKPEPKKSRGSAGGAVMRGRAQAQSAERREKVLLWLELRKAMNSTNAARALGGRDTQMRNWAREAGIDVPLLPSGGAGAKQAQSAAFLAYMAEQND